VLSGTAARGRRRAAGGGGVVLDWDLPAPYVASLAVAAADIDAYDHVNNAVFMTWFDRAAWDHSAALGLPIEACLQLDRGMAVLRSVIAYLRPALLGDGIRVATWLLPADGKLRIRRRFQVRRDAQAATLARAEIEYACIELSSGRPARWPPQFRERYVARDDVVRALATLAPI
jgi:acyl-CoA thioester hydrolase